MAGAIVAPFARMSVAAPSHASSPCTRSVGRLTFSSSLRGSPLLCASRQTLSPARAAVFQVDAKQNSLKRERTAEKARQYNKSRKSAIATRIKKVLNTLQTMRTNLPASEDALKPVEKLISEAYQEIDKAIVKGVIHANTGARRKSRIAVAKRKLLVDAGLYTPASA